MRGLKAGWRDDHTDQWCDTKWLSLALLKASVPKEAAERITAVAVDGTDYPTFALCRVFDNKNKTLTDTVVDLEAEAKRAAKERKKAGLAEPEDPYEYEETDDAPPQSNTVSTDDQLGAIGDDGRAIRGKDTEARVGRHSATGSRPAGYYLGYELIPAVAVKSFSWHGDPDEFSFGDPVPGYVLALGIAPAGANPGPVGYETIQQAQQVAVGIDEVVADRGFTTKRLTFNRPLHQANINLLMDYKDQVIANPKAVSLGKRGDAAIQHAGTYLHAFTPLNLQVPDEVFIKTAAAQLKQADIDEGKQPNSDADYTERATQQWYGQRAKLFTYTVHEHKNNGHKRIVCPVHSGKIAIPATSRSDHQRAPRITVPKGHKGQCCPGTVTVRVDELDLFQNVPYGTRAWSAAYRRRNKVESVIGILKGNGGLEKNNCRAFGLVPRHLAATAIAVAYNLQLTRAANSDNASDDHEASDDDIEPRSRDNADVDSPPIHQTGQGAVANDDHNCSNCEAPTGLPPPT